MTATKSTYKLLPNEHLVDRDGATVPAREVTYSCEVRDVWTDGRLLGDGVERIIAQTRENERWHADGVEVPGPVKIIRQVDR